MTPNHASRRRMLLGLGITSKDKIPTGMLDQPHRPIAYNLLADFEANMSASDENRFAMILFNMGAGDNVKRTFPGRYRAVDEAIEAELGRLFEEEKLVRIHELAASTAIISLDLFERLRNRKRLQVHATDFFDQIYALFDNDSGWTVIFDAELRPLQFVGSRMVIAADRKENQYWINRQIQKKLFKTVLPRATAKFDKATNSDGAGIKRISLFHPRCLDVAQRDSRFTLGRENAFAPGDWSCEVLRVMSFSHSLKAEETTRFFSNVCQRVVDGGLLVVGDHPDIHSEPAVTIFQRKGYRMLALRDLGGGYFRKSSVVEVNLAK